jgi:hypothetical protein
MINAAILSKEIAQWAREHAWYGKTTAKLKARHFTYLSALIERMDEPSEASMNRAWCSIPPEERLSDTGSRVVCELITSYFTAHRSNNT